MYSGNPAPDVVWYKNDKLVMNTPNVKVRIFEEDRKTSLLIKHATEEDDATYVCKATSEIGLATTKAKLRVTDITGDNKFYEEEEVVEEEIKEVKPKPKKKKPELKKAKETKEKIKSERVKVDKKEVRKEKLSPKEQPEEKKIVDIEETQVLESTEIIEEKPTEVSRAKKIVPVQEPVMTEATPSLKKIDDQKPRELAPKPEERAQRVVEEREGVVVVSEVTTEDLAPDFVVESIVDRAQITSETLETVSISEVHTETNVQEVRRIEAKQRKAKKTVVTEEELFEEQPRKAIVEEKPKKRKKDKVKIREEISIEEIVERERENIAREVEEIMDTLHAKEFGPGEAPLRELATIGFLVRQGVTVNEINESLYRTENFPALKTPEAQNALVQLVEREGHGPLITQVLTEETTTDESVVAATVGFRAFMRMIELQHVTVEEVLTHFAPEDFRPRAWEVTEATEVETEERVTERVDIVRKTEVHIMERRDERKAVRTQDIRDIKEYEDTRQAHTTLREQIEEGKEDRGEGVQVVETIEEVEEIEKRKRKDAEEIEEEIETVIVETDKKGRLTRKQKKVDEIEKHVDVQEEEEKEEEVVEEARKVLKAKRPQVGRDELELEEIEEFEVKEDKSVASIMLNVPSQRHQIVPLDQITEQAPGKPELEKAKLTMDTVTALTEQLVPIQEKETDISQVKPVERKASLSISPVEPYSTTETTVQASTGEFSDTFKPISYEATPGIVPKEGLVVSEILTNDARVSSLTTVKQELSRTADVSMTVQEATTVYETMVSQKEVPTEDFVTPLAAEAEKTVLSQIGLSVYEVQEGLVEDKLEPLKTAPAKPRVNVTAVEPLVVEEVRPEDKPGKYYPELIVPTEIATQTVISQKQRVTEEMHAPEKEGEYVPGRLPPSQKAQVGISYGNETAVIEQNVIQESEGVYVSERKVDTFEAMPNVTLLEGVSVSTVQTQDTETDLTIEETKKVEADLNIVEISSAVTVETVPSEKEQDYQPGDKPATKTAETSISSLEIGSISSTIIQESEGIYQPDQKPTKVLAETSIRPEEHVMVSEIHTADYPSDFKDELKYVQESGTVTVQLTEAKVVQETLIHDQETKMEEVVKPEERVVDTSYDAIRSVEVFQTTSVEKEADLKIFEMPESHRGKTVPTHPVVSLEVEMTQPEDNLGEISKDAPSSGIAKIIPISLQETVVDETVVAEDLATVQKDKVPESKVAEVMLNEIESLHTTMVVASEKEAEYTEISEVKGAYASTEFATQVAPVFEEVRTHSPTGEYVPEETPASGVAQPSHVHLESLTIAMQEVAEKEDLYKIDVKPDGKTAVVELTEPRPGATVLEIIPHDRENIYSPDEKPQDYTAQPLISGHTVALKSETLVEQSTADISTEQPKLGTAVPQRDALEELIVTETNIAETEKIREEDTKPVTQSAEMEICSKSEKLTVTEVMTVLSEENLQVEDLPKERQVTMAITGGHEVAEMEETIIANNIDVLKEEKAKEEHASQQQSGLEVVEQTEVSVSEKESTLLEDVKPDTKKVDVVFEEGEGIVVGMTYPEDKEGIFTGEEKPKSMEATVDIVAQGVATTFEVTSDTGLSELLKESIPETKPKTTILPIEAAISEEVQTRETEAPFTEVKPTDKTAKLEFVTGEGLIVSSVTAGDKETSLPEAEKPETKSATFDIPTHIVAEISETTTTDNVDLLKREETTSATATTDHITFHSMITTETATGDLEKPMEDFVQPDKKIVDVSFEEGIGVTVTETIVSDKEKEYFKKLELHGEQATPAFDAHKVAQSMEVTPSDVSGDLTVPAPTTAAAKEETLPFESIMQTETIVSETEKEFIDNAVVSNKAEVSINEIISATTTTEIPADKEDVLRIPEKPSEKQASIQLAGHVIAEKTEVTVDSSAGKLEELKPVSASAVPSSVPLEAVISSETQPTEAEGVLSKDKTPTQALADLSVIEDQSIQVSTVVLEDKEEEYKTTELPEMKTADKSLVGGHVVAQTTMQVVDFSTGDFVDEKPSEATAIPKHVPFTPLIESQAIVQESEDKFVPGSMPENKKAVVDLEEGRNIVTVSQVTPADKESLYISEEAPSKHAASVGLDIIHTIAETTKVSIQDSIADVTLEKPDAKKALPTQEVYQSVLVTQDIVQDQEDTFEGKFKPTVQQVEISIEEGKRVTTVTEVSAVDREGVLKTVLEEKTRSAVPAIVSGHEVAERSEIIPQLSTGKVDVIKPTTATAQVGQKPFETVETIEQVLAEKEVDKVEELTLLKTSARVTVDENRFIAITEATTTQDVEADLSEMKKPREETAKPAMEGKEVAEQMEVNLREGLGEVPAPIKPTAAEAHPTQTTLESVDVSETVPQEHGTVFEEKMKLDERSATVTFVEGKSITVAHVITQDKEDTMTIEKREENKAEVTLTKVGMDIAQKAEVFVDQSTGEVRPLEKHEAKAQPTRDALQPVIVEETPSAESEGTFDKYPKAVTSTATTTFEEGHGVSVTEVTSAEVESILKEKKLDVTQTATSTIIAERSILETTMVESQVNIPDKTQEITMTPQVAIPGQETFESIIVRENIVEETEQTFEGVFKPQTQKADIDIEKVKSLQVSETISEDKETTFDVAPKREGVKATQDISLHETVVGSMTETIQSIQEIQEEKQMSTQATMTQTLIETAVKTETTVGEREETFEGKFKPEEQKGKPQFEGLSTVMVTEVVSNEIEDVLPTDVAPKTQQAQPSLTGREAPEVLQVITAATTEELEKMTKLKEQQGTLEVEELTSVAVSEVISNEAEDILTLKATPKDQKADFNILGREAAETTQVTTIAETEDLALMKPEEQKGKPKVDELTPLTVSHVVSGEAEKALPVPEVPKEKTAQPSLLARDVAETMQVLTVASAEELLAPQAPEEKKGKPQVEELAPLTVSQVVSHEAEDTLPTPEVPVEREAQPNLIGRDVAQTMEVLTMSNVDILTEDKKPGEQRGVPGLEEFVPLSVSQTVSTEMEDVLPSPEVPTEKMAQPSLLGRDVAETMQVLTMISTQELTAMKAPEEQKGKPNVEELTSLTISQTVSHETEEVLEKTITPSTVTAKPALTGREVAETSQVLTVSNVEELEKPVLPEEQTGKPSLDELTSLTVSQIISSELEDTLPSPEKPSEKIAQPQMIGREVAEKTEVLTVTNVEELQKLEKPEGQRGKPDVEELSFITVSEVVSTEKEKEMPHPEAPKQRKALPKLDSIEVAETSEVLTMTSAEELPKTKAPEEQKGKPQLTELLSLSVSEVAYSEAEMGLPTPDEPTTQTAKPSLFGIQVAQKSQVIPSSGTEELEVAEKPETKKIIPEQIPFEGIELLQPLPQESEGTLVVEKTSKTATAEVSFQVSESLEVTQVTATEQEAKEVIKGVAKEASAQPDVVKREVALKTEIQPEDAASEFKVSKPESKTAKGVNDVQQGVIVTEHLATGELESDLPESVIPFAKLVNVSIVAEHLEQVVDVAEKTIQQEEVVEEVVEEVKQKKVPKKKKPVTAKDEVTEEIVEEITIEQPEKQRIKPTVEEEETVTITEIDVKKAPKKKKEVVIKEEEEIFETIETPTQKIIRKKIRPMKKGEKEVVVEEIITKPKEETIEMEEQQIVEVIETPTKKIVKKKKAVTKEDGVPEEVIEEIHIEKPQKEKAKPLVEEEKETVKVTKVVLKKAPEKPEEIIEEEEIIETIETPTKKIIRKKPKEKKDKVVEEVIEKTVEEAKVMEEQEIVEIVETPTKKVIKKKRATVKEGKPVEEVEELVIEKPVKEKAKGDVIPKEGVEITEIITETPVEELKEEKVKPEEAKPSEIKEKKAKVSEVTVKKAPKKKKPVTAVEAEEEEEIVEEITLEKPKEEKVKPTVTEKEGVEITEVVTEVTTEELPEKVKPKKKKVSEIEEIEEKVVTKKVPVKKAPKEAVPETEEQPEEKVEELIPEKPKKTKAKKEITPSEGIITTEVVTTTAEETLEVEKPEEDKALVTEEEQEIAKVEEKTVTVKKAPKKKLKPTKAEEEQVEEVVEEITTEEPKKRKAKKTVIPKEEIETTEVVTEVTTEEIEEEKPEEEKAVPKEEEKVEEEAKVTEVPVKKAPKEKKKKKKEEPITNGEVIEEKLKEKEIPEEKPEEKEIPEEKKPEVIEKPKEEVPKVPEEKEVPKEKPKEEKPKVKKPKEEKPIEEKPKDEKPIEEKPEEVKPKEEKPIEEKPKEEKPKEEKPKKKKVPAEKKPTPSEEVQVEEKVEEIPEEKPKKVKAKKEVVPKETIETTEVIPEAVPEELSTKKPEERKAVPVEEKEEKVEVTEVPTEKAPEKKEEEKKVLEEKPVEKVPEKPKEVKEKKKKKKPVKKDEIEEWVEPEYERPVLEPMPEKIQWEPSKKKKEKKELPAALQKLVPEKIERKEIKPTKLKYSEPAETIQFAAIKLKKVAVTRKKEVSKVKIPKIMLRSTLQYVTDYPPEMQIPEISYLEENPVQSGILSRNTEEALQVLKRKVKKVKLPGKETTELEKLDQEFEELKKVPLEKVEDKSVYERPPKKPAEKPEEPQKVPIGKGKVPEEEKVEPEKVKLKKIPDKKPEEEVEPLKKPVKQEPEEEVKPEKKKKPKVKLEHDELKPLDFERPELEKYEPEEYEKPEEPKPEPVPKPYEREEKKKPDQEIEQVPIIKGEPKPPEPTEEPEVKFRIPEKEKPEEEGEKITLKPWKKDKPEEEAEKEVPVKEKEEVPKVPKEETEDVTIKRKAKPKKPKEKAPKEEEVTIKKPEPEKPKEVPEVTEEVPLKKEPEKPVEEAPAEVTIKKPVVEEKEVVEEEVEVVLKKKPKKPEEVVEEAVVKKPKKKPVKEEEVAEVTVKKPIVEEKVVEEEEVKEEVVIKKKPKEKPVPEEVTEEVTLKKPEEKAPEEVTEEIKKPKKKKPVKEEVAEEVTIKKPVVEEKKEEEAPEEVTLKKKKPKEKPVPEEVTEEVTLKKPEPKEEVKVPEEMTEEVELKKPKKKKPVVEEAVDEVTIKKVVVEEKKEEEVPEQVTLKKKKPKEKPVPEEVTEEVTLKKPEPEEKVKVPEEVTEEVELKKPKKKKPVVEEAADEVTIKKVVIEEKKEEEVPEQVTLKKKKPKEKPVPEEVTEEVTLKKPEPEEKVKVPEEVREDVELKKPKKKKPVVEEAADEVTIKKVVVEEKKEEEAPEEVTLKKKKPKEKPVPEEVTEEVTLKKPVPEEKIKVPEEVTEEVELKKPKKKKPVVEEAADEVTIKKVVVEEKKEEEVPEEVTLKKKKPKEKPVPEEVAEEVTLKKPVPKEKEKSPEETTEKVEIKKPKKKKPVVEEVADEVTIKKVVVEEKVEEEAPVEVTLKPKKKKSIPKEEEEEVAEVTLTKPKPAEEEKKPEEAEVTLKKKPKKKPVVEEEAAEVTIKKLVPTEAEETPEEVTIKKKKKPEKRPSVTEEIEETSVTLKKTRAPEKPVEEEEVSSDVQLKKKKTPRKIEEVAADELTIKKVEEIEQPEEEEVHEFTFKRKPPKLPPKLVEEICEDVTLRKLRPKKKPRPDIKEVTEAENVTFRPRSTKTKEDVEQEFKISLNTYEEEDISMSGKVRLKPKKRPMTYSEETGEETIRILKEIEDDSGPIVEEIIDESDEEAKDEYSIEELETDELNLPLRRKKKKVVKPYKVEDIEEGDVMLKLKRDRKYSVEETDESLELKLKSKRRVSTYDEEEATLSITREEDISEEEEIEYVVRDGDIMFSICSYVAETDEAINLVEGERVYVIDHTNQDWWFVKKHLTEEKGWVPAQYLLNEVHYTLYLQRKLHEKIDKLPVFEKPLPGEKSSAPRFIEKLQPIHTPDGYTVQFECQVEGLPRPQITWFRQTAIIKPSPDFQMYYDEDNVATLIIREVFPEDAGTFTCVAKNAAGFASSTTELIVEAPLSDHGSDLTGPSRKSLSRESSLADILEGIPPTFSRKPKAKYVNEGDDVILECRLVAVPEPEITWYYKDKQITTKQNIIVATESDMHMYCSVIKITKVQKKQEGKYTIVAKNREGEATIEIPMKVKTGKQEPPEILEPLQSYVVREGETVVLSTQIVGNPAPKVTWYKNGKPLKGLTPKQDGHVNTLTLIQPQVSDSGDYSVVATNDLGTVETKATLTVEKIPTGAPEPPLFTERFQELTVPEKGTFRLVAKVTGNPVPEVTWLRNNLPLEKSPNIMESYDGENIVLEIRNANSEVDAGDYKCIASNPVGKASHGARVTVDVDKVTFTKELEKEVIVDEYKTLELTCETSHTVSTKWWHNHKEVSGMDHREIIQEGHVHKLVIKKTSPTDEGFYECTVKNQSTASNVTVKATKPEFVKKLQDCEVKERDVAILEVEITSQSADVKWFKDGEPLGPSKEKLDFVKDGTVRKLLIRSTSVHDEGEYSCTLMDETCSAEVTVIELPPEIITKMQDVTIARGERATFEIEVTKGDALIRWFKDGQELQFSEHVQLSIDGKRQKLKIYDTEPEDAAVYSCEVGKQTSSARLTVEEPGVDFITKLPDVTLVPLNADAVFTIELSQNVPVTWHKKTEVIKESSKYTIIDEGTVKKLIVKKCTIEDISEYTAVVTNVKTSSKLRVEVIETPPKISPDTPTKYKVREGEDVEIVVKFTGTPKPSDEWTVNGTVVTKSKRVVPSLDEECASLTIRKIQEEEVGNYTLKLSNQVGETSIEISVVIVHVPSAPGAPEPLEITTDSVTLHWKKPDSDGNSPIIEYILEHQEKTETSWTKITEKIVETTHKVTKLITNNEYTFRVTAVNEAGPGDISPTSPYIKISKPSATEPPVVLEPLKSVIARLNETVTLSCIIGGTPTPDITWLRNGETFEDSAITYENRMAKYTITKTTETSSATFTVKAKNNLGTAETTCELKVQEPPKINYDETLASQNLPVNNQWKIEVQTSGFPKPEVTWSKNSKKIVDKHVSIQTEERTSTILIASLIREDTATYTVKASNQAGSSSVDLHLRVIDKPSKPQGPIVFKEIRQDRVTLEWRPPADDGGIELEKYTIEKCEPGKAWVKVVDIDKEVESFCVHKLQQDAEYKFRIIARNIVGASEPLESDTVKMRTSFEPPGPPRGPLEVSGMTKTSFTIKWQPPENDGGTPITEYIVEMKEESKKAWQKIGTTKYEVTHLIVSDLKTDVPYNFRITAKNSVGTSPPYVAEEPITPGKRPTPPSSPKNVQVTNVTSKSVTLSWAPPASNGGTELTGYVIEKRPLIGKGARWTKVVTLDATTLQYCVENLKESEFLFRIFAENNQGLSLPTNSEPVTLKTHATVPSPPTAPLEIRQIAANTVVISWGRPESDGGAPLEGYKIAIRDAKKTMWMEVGRVTAEVQKLNIRDLQENHMYLIRIYARNEIGLSDPLESDEPVHILPASELSVIEPIAEATEKGETASVSFSTENTSSWLREHNMDADIHSYARARLLRKDEYFFRIWHYAKKLFE
nr:titin-like isoform X2 [Nomia melanderi]